MDLYQAIKKDLSGVQQKYQDIFEKLEQEEEGSGDVMHHIIIRTDAGKYVINIVNNTQLPDYIKTEIMNVLKKAFE